MKLASIAIFLYTFFCLNVIITGQTIQNLDESCTISRIRIYERHTYCNSRCFRKQNRRRISRRISHCLFNNQFETRENGELRHQWCCWNILHESSRAARNDGRRCPKLASSRIYRHGEKRRAAVSCGACSLPIDLLCSRALPLLFLAILRKIAPSCAFAAWLNSDTWKS